MVALRMDSRRLVISYHGFNVLYIADSVLICAIRIFDL
jgi:hypothetical protein